MALDPEVAEAINGLWVFVAGVMCFLLQAGFGLLEVGSVRAKNAQNIMIKNLLDACVAALSYWAVGYAFAYGEGGNPFIGSSFFFLIDTQDYINWFFQMVFAGTTATIVSGAVAERCQFRAYLIYSAILTAFIYPVVSHWEWHPDGFLYGKLLDYAGGAAVHGVGGVAAFAGAYILGPRIGRFVYNQDTQKHESRPIPGHNLVLAALGGFLLWFGFFPFNVASGANIVGDQFLVSGRVAVVTTLGGASGAVTLLTLGFIKSRSWDLMLALNGLLAGMVATCSGVNVYHPWTSLIIGITGSLAYYGQAWVMEHILRIDDPLGASALHMGSGFWGTLMVGFFAHGNFVEEHQVGVFFGGNGKQLGWQIAGILVDFSWAMVTSSIMFVGLKQLNMFRVDPEEETRGMDLTHHGGLAYRTYSKVDRDTKQSAIPVVEGVSQSGEKSDSDQSKEPAQRGPELREIELQQ